MLAKIFHYPSKNLVIAIPVVLAAGFAVGSFLQTDFLKDYILIATFFMIYPTMIGFKLKEAVDLSHWQVLFTSLIVNFIAIPAIAYLIGRNLLSGHPQLFAGLVIASLLPTSGMTISWTMLHKGNVPAAIKITAVSLIAGSLLTPWYLYYMVGKMVPIDIQQTMTTIAIVVFVPLILGNITYRLICRKYTPQEFQKRIKPILPSLSVWAMMFLIFSSISMKAKVILGNPQLIIKALLVLALFYAVNFTLSTITGKYLLKKVDAIALVYGTVMRNLSIALALAFKFFGSEAALIVTLAFILQVQGAAWYGRVADKLALFKEKPVLEEGCKV